MVNAKGDTVVCIRVESNVQFSKHFPSWIHRLKEVRKTKPSDETTGEFIEGNPKEEPENLHTVFKGLLDATRLTNAHYDHLINREMSDEEIFIREYRSFPEQPWNTAKDVAEITEIQDFTGIPGFFQNNYGWSISGREGILIPYRNEYNQIVGFQTRIDKPKNDVEVTPGSINGLQARVKEQPNLVQILVDGEIIEEVNLELEKMHSVYRDGVGFVKLVKGKRYFWLSSANKKNGTGAGDPMPVHVAVPTNELEEWETGTLRKASSVWITEGALKADIAVEHIEKVYDPEELSEIGTTFLAVAGVNTWRAAMPILKEMEVCRVNIAFDMDALQNAQVAFYLQQLIKELKNEKYSVNLALWNAEEDGKGIDDALTKRRYPKLKKMF